ncbi:MAG: ABC-F family ATP-binding cassette domain-containing protein [Verrucomicrobiota bacterium]
MVSRYLFMLTLGNISKSFAGRDLYIDASLQVNRGDRIGLVGPNGAGKSTLFSIILGDESPDNGSVNVERGVTVGFLPQETAPVANETVMELAMSINEEMAELYSIVKKHEAEGTEEDETYHIAQEKYVEYGGYQLEPKAKRILKGLAFRDSDFERPARELSGGWVMRAHLAKLLVMEPTLLMLDEPTNHLDLETVMWFQNYLKLYPGGILMISHDREFLNCLVGSIVEVRARKLQKYRGNYDNYLEQKDALAVQQLAAYKNQQKEMERLQQFADRFRAKASKASQAQAKLKQIARMDKLEAPEAEDRVMRGFRFPQPKRSGQRVMELKDIYQAYGQTRVYEGLNAEVERDQRTVLVGPNGAGKSTLLKIMAGALDFEKGERKVGHNVTVGYFSQNRVEMLDSSRTVLEEATAMEHPVTEQVARTILGSFLFQGDDVFKPVSVLSGGEKSRLGLVKLLLAPPNFLLMDEPTTHLDMASIEALISALKQYQGTLVFISHDVYFIKSMAETVWQVHAGKVTPFAGGYDYYLEKTQAESEKVALTAGEKLEDHRGNQTIALPEKSKNTPRPVRKTKEQKRKEAEERQARSKIKKDLEKEVARLEERILHLESRQKELLDELQNPAPDRAKRVNEEMYEVQIELNKVSEAWEEKGEALMSL